MAINLSARPAPRIQRRPQALTLGTLNIQRGRHNGLLLACRAAKIANFDLILFTEAKITDDAYAKTQFGFEIYCTKATSTHQGGLALATKTTTAWHIEGIQAHGPNVLSALLITGSRRTPIIGAYLPPGTLDDLPFLESALNRFPSSDPIVLGDLNADLSDATSPRNRAIANFVATYGLCDILTHFRQRRGHHDRHTWFKRVNGQLRTSRCDHILSCNRRLFEAATIIQLRHYATDHYAIKARYLLSKPRRYLTQLRRRKQPPFQLQTPFTPTDHIFLSLALAANSPAQRILKPANSWLSPKTLQIMDQQASINRQSQGASAQLQRLRRQLKRSIAADRQARADAAAQTIQAELDKGNTREAWASLKKWYHHATTRPSRPTREDITKVTNDFKALYTQESPSPPGAPIPCTAMPWDIPDNAPDEAKIYKAVKNLRKNRSPGVSGLRAEDFQQWADEALPLETETGVYYPTLEQTGCWQAVISLVQSIWDTGTYPQRATWTVLALIPKGASEFQGIGLLEVLPKLIESIIHSRIGLAARWHDAIHGFRQQRGTTTAIMELKLTQELASISQRPLFLAFLDLRKAYDTLDRERTLATLTQYGCGHKTTRLIRSFWNSQQLAARQSGFYGPVFAASRGITQGGPLSATVFNIVMDNLVQYWLTLVMNDNGQAAAHGLGNMVSHQIALCYADDNLIGSRNPEWLQQSLNVFVGLCRRLGLSTNTEKSTVMTSLPGAIRTCLSTEAYQRRSTGYGLTYRDRLHAQTVCPECGVTLAKASLVEHRRRQHAVEPSMNWNMASLGVFDHDPVTYQVSFPRIMTACPCPVDGCPGTFKTWASLRGHMARRHWNATIHILEESCYPLPKCKRCGLQLHPQSLNTRHYLSAMCLTGSKQIRQRQAEQRAFAASNMTFTIRDTALEPTLAYRYLGRLVTNANSDWPAVLSNLKRARTKWAMLARLLTKEGISVATKGTFYRAVVMAVLLYGAGTWVTSSRIARTLAGFHHKVIWRITGSVPFQDPAGKWRYPPIKVAMTAARLRPIMQYIANLHNSIADMVATRPIHLLCQDATSLTGSAPRTSQWWNQAWPANIQDYESDHSSASSRIT